MAFSHISDLERAVLFWKELVVSHIDRYVNITRTVECFSLNLSKPAIIGHFC